MFLYLDAQPKERGLVSIGYGWTYTWEHGRQLASMTNGTTTNYGENPVVETLYFGNGTVTYNGEVYYYVTNLQGDVIAILDDEGNAVVEYTYDAWGNVLTISGTMSETLGEVNPLTYRGYVYDTESGVYYLQSRYYNPETGRFINADTLVSTKRSGLGCAIFTYCLNNPLNYVDTAGTDAIWIQEGDSAQEQGHTGLMVQDEDGNWFYFFWGPLPEDETEADIIKLCTGVLNGAYYIPCDEDIAQLDLHETSEVITLVKKASDTAKVKDRSGKITRTIYLEGDFSSTHEYLMALCGPDAECDELYNLLLNNCVQKSMFALSLSDARFTPLKLYYNCNGITLLIPAVHPNYEFGKLILRLKE